MPTSSIAQILLRIYALGWFVKGMIQLGASLIAPGGVYFPNLGYSLVYPLVAIFIWIYSPAIARLAAKDNDESVRLVGVSERALLSTAFVAIGLYFALTSLGGVINWAHFFTVSKSPDYGFHKQQQEVSYYQLTEEILTFGAGLILVFTSRVWARKLTRSSNSEHDAAEPISEPR